MPEPEDHILTIESQINIMDVYVNGDLIPNVFEANLITGHVKSYQRQFMKGQHQTTVRHVKGDIDLFLNNVQLSTEFIPLTGEL